MKVKIAAVFLMVLVASAADAQVRLTVEKASSIKAMPTATVEKTELSIIPGSVVSTAVKAPPAYDLPSNSRYTSAPSSIPVPTTNPRAASFSVMSFSTAIPSSIQKVNRAGTYSNASPINFD